MGAGSISGSSASNLTIGGITGTAAAGETASVTRINLVHESNDVPRLISHKSISADYSYSNSIGTTYEDLDVADELLIHFTVPPSAMVECDLTFYASEVEGQTIMVRLVNNSGDEFVDEYIDDEELCITTDNTHVFTSETGTGYYDTINTSYHVKWVLKFASGNVGSSYYIKPQAKTSTGTITHRFGKAVYATYPPTMFKMTSLENSSQFTHSVIES